MEKLQRRQRELARQKENRTRTTEPAATASRPESRMEVDEAPRPSGRFNLDRATQEHMNEGLEVWIPPEPLPSVHCLDTQSIRTLMEVKLPGYTPSLTTSSSQAGLISSRLKVLQDRLQSRARGDSVREGRPLTWRDHPVRSVTIASYKKNKDGAYHRHNRMYWTAAQRAMRDCFHEAAWAEYFTQPRIPDGAVHLIIGDSLIRVLTRIQSQWQVGALTFSGAATPQMFASLEMLDMVKMYTVTLMMGTNEVSRGESRKVMRLHEKMSCILQELRIWFDPAILTIRYTHHLKIVTTADRFWKPMPAALKRPALDELYKRLRDLDYTQVDERMAVMLNAILKLEAQDECWKSATEAVLVVGYTTEGISNQEQTRWLPWKVDGGVSGFDLARNPGCSNNTEYGAGEFPLSARPPAGLAVQSTSRPSSMIRSQQTEEAYPDLGSLKRELERAQREKDKANLDRDGAKLERDQANLERDQAILERDQAWRDLNMIRGSTSKNRGHCAHENLKTVHISNNLANLSHSLSLSFSSAR